MKRSLREVLAESHIAAITIAVLLFSFFDATFEASWPFIYEALHYVFLAIAILGVPYFSLKIYPGIVVNLCAYLCFAVVSFLGAYMLSRCVYGLGPFAVLATYRYKLMGRKYV